jgi:hypothetical protein
MSDQPSSGEIPANVLGHDARLARRAAARVRRRRRRRINIAAAAAALAVLAVVLALAGGGSSGSKHGPRRTPARARSTSTAAIVKRLPGGPVAPAAFGGLAALWAPTNVVGMQPGTAAAYSAAAALPRLPGYLLIADRGNNRILLVNLRHRVVFRYPTPSDRAHLYFDDDVFVEPGGKNLISNEEDGYAVVQVNPVTRRMKVLFGVPGVPGGDETHLNSPDDAYMLPDGTFTVADASNCRILFIRRHRIVRSYGHSGECRHEPPRYFTAVNGDTPLPNGGVMASEIEGSWLDEIGPEGKLRWSVKAPVIYPSDPQPLPGGRVLLADYANPGHLLIIDRSGKVLWRYGPRYGHGRLDHPSLAMALPNGDIAVNDDYRDRVLVIDPRTNEIVWQYGHTDKPGTAPGYLSIPDGMDFVPAAPDGSPDFAAVVHP